MLRKPYPGMPEGRPIAMARVRYAFEDAVEVKILYQIPGENNVLDGAMAQAVPAGERVRLAQYVGRVLEQDKAGRVKLDVGKSDGAEVGDMYSVLEEGEGDAIARVKLTEVRDLEAWGKVMDWHEPVRVGMDAQYEGPDDGKIATPISVVVVDFMAKSVGDAGEAKAGKEFARDLVKALERAAEGMPYLKVKYAPEEKVKGLSGEAEGHREAQALGKKMGADVVVWGVMQCDIRGCALPRFTVVEGSRLAQGRFRGEEIWVEKKGDGFKFEGKAPEDPLALGAALLGEVFYNAQRHKDAKFYLGMALRKGVLRGHGVLQGQRYLVRSLRILGHNQDARIYTLALRQQALAMHDLFYEITAAFELADIDRIEGHSVAARKGYEDVITHALQKDYSDVAGAALNQLAFLKTHLGLIDEANQDYSRALELAHAHNNVTMEADTLHNFGILKANMGKVEEASKLIDRSIALKQRYGDELGIARSQIQLARFEFQTGHLEQAQKRLSSLLELVNEHIGDIECESAILNELGRIYTQQDRFDDAEQSYQQSLAISDSLFDVDGMSATLHNLGQLRLLRNRPEEARDYYHRSMILANLVGNIKAEARTLNDIAFIESKMDLFDAAKDHYLRALELKKFINDVEGEIVTRVNLAVLEYRRDHTLGVIQTLTDTLVQAQKGGYKQFQASILSLIGQIEIEKGLIEDAKAHFDKSLRLYIEIGMPAEIKSLRTRLSLLDILKQAVDFSKAHPDLFTNGGVVVVECPSESNGLKANLKVGDIIIRYGAHSTPTVDALLSMARSTDSSRTITLDVLRGVQHQRFQVPGGSLGVTILALPPTSSTSP